MKNKQGYYTGVICERCGEKSSGHLKCERCGILMHRSLEEQYRCDRCGEFHGRVSIENPSICWQCAGEKPMKDSRPVLIRQSIGQSSKEIVDELTDDLSTE